ncbi:MAG: hypothetical protein ACTSRU_19075 [Candidatus Hodarchaeales archaeon]
MYAEKSEILGVIQFLRPDMTSEDDISDDIQALAEADVNGRLAREQILTFPADDIGGLLKASEICFYMEICGMLRETENAFGVIGMEKMGAYTKKYENGMPMFFFASGTSKPFLELLPHESWRMRGFKYMHNYVDAYYMTENEEIACHGVVGQDAEWY